MAKDNYVNTYKTYKAGTTKLISWLVENGRSAGADLSFLPNNPIAKASGKNAAHKPTSRHQVPVQELVKLAESIADADPIIKVPQSIVDVAESVVRLRKHAARSLARLAKAKDSQFASSDARHRHFISILEKVVATLRPSVDDTPDSPAEGTTVNVFCASWQWNTVAEPETTSPAPAIVDDTDVDEYELEREELDEILQIYAFFKEVNDLRGYIKDLWHHYRQGKLDLMSASITTDTALGIMRRSSDELGESIPNGSHWPTLAGKLRTYLSALGGANEAFFDFVCAHSARRLDGFAAMLDPNSIPVMKPGHFGVYNPEHDRSKFSDKEKEREDAIIFLELLPEFAKISRVNLEMPVPDELTDGLMKMMDACTVEALPMYAIFASEVLLDIHHVLREDATRPFEELQEVGKRVVKAADQWLGCSRSRPIAIWPPQNDDIIKQLRAVAHEWTQEDIVAQAAARARSKWPGKPRPHWLLKNHPVLSGLLAFHLNVNLQEAGMDVCTSWGSVVYAAHIYNAAYQSADLESRWADMDYLISVHSPQRIYVGSPPTDTAEYIRRYLLAMGASASNFARNRRPGGEALVVPSRKGPRGLKTTSPVKDIFGPKYIYRESSAVPLSTPNRVAMLSVARKAERTSSSSVDLQSFSREMLVQKQFTPIQLLTIVREGVAAEELHLLFDYFGMHEKGHELFRNLQTALHDQLVNAFRAADIEGASQLPFIVGYIFRIASGSDRIAEELNIHPEERCSRVLYAASEVLARFLESANGAEIIEQTMALSNAGRFATQA